MRRSVIAYGFVDSSKPSYLMEMNFLNWSLWALLWVLLRLKLVTPEKSSEEISARAFTDSVEEAFEVMKGGLSDGLK